MDLLQKFKNWVNAGYKLEIPNLNYSKVHEVQSKIQNNLEWDQIKKDLYHLSEYKDEIALKLLCLHMQFSYIKSAGKQNYVPFYVCMQDIFAFVFLTKQM